MFHRLSESIRSQPEWLIWAEGFLLVLLVGVIDYLTSYDLTVFVLYSLPILFLSWFAGQKAGIAAGVTSAIVWAVADRLSGHHPHLTSVALGNAFLQVGFFIFVVLCSAALKAQLDRTQAQVTALQRFHLLAEIAPVGIFRAGPDGECLYVNQRWRNIMGLKDNDPLPGRWTEALHPDDRERVEAQWSAALKGHRPLQYQARFCHPDGKPVWVLGHLAAEYSPQGAVTGYVGTVADTTHLRELEAQVLQISEREQQRIGQDLHDDLCQFLAAIQYAASSLRSDLRRRSLPEAEEASEIADLLKDAVMRTRGMARRIFPVQLERIGLTSALHELASSMSRLAGVHCTFEYEPPLYINNNEVATHLYRIAQEALANAIKHGQAKEVVIRLESRNPWLTLSVIDNGKGIPPNAPQTTGMGLRIMEYRSNMIGGTLQVVPNPEGGTIVRCTLRTPQPV